MKKKISGKNKIIAILASVYTIYGIYAGGIKYFALAFIMYASGAIVFNKAKKEKKQKYTSMEKIGTAVVVFVGVAMIVLLAIGKISL